MDRMKNSMQQVPNAIPKVIRRTGGANSLELEKENFERGQISTKGPPAEGMYAGCSWAVDLAASCSAVVSSFPPFPPCTGEGRGNVGPFPRPRSDIYVRTGLFATPAGLYEIWKTVFPQAFHPEAPRGVLPGPVLPPQD
ncbi:hypothetical protein D4764_12G0012600 [Takifugu flavidus]|uniref:Uncharacterized protein n=1 Tax=Takifugu flavidus TaxID=433684 RepID=A0A5C6PHY0_9TELE|nr:hypothetical protein D4764_12G0012600 [Takifugu flavidus]